MNKFEQLIVYIAKKSESDPGFGAVKLNKLLFFADFSFYRRFGRSITGQNYVRRQNGPCPTSMVSTTKKLISSGKIAIQKSDYFGLTQKRTLALTEADLTDFNGEEIAMVDKIIDFFRDADATKVSEISHHFFGWTLAKDGEKIPYGTALISIEPPTDKEAQYAQRFAKS